MTKTNYKKLANFMFEVGTLRKIPRAHRQTLLTNSDDDNIASHSHRVAMIGMVLALAEGLDVGKVVQMCMLHDIAEIRSSDQNWIHKKYVKVFEDEITESQLRGLPKSEYIKGIIDEYDERKTKEAVLAKDADLLDQILLLKEYEWGGNKEASQWLKGGRQLKMIKTPSAKRVGEKIYKTNPSEWWDNIWTEKRR